MGYQPNTADIIANILQGSSNVESIIRANSLDELTSPAANVSWNSHRITNLSNGIVSTDVPSLSQLAENQYPFVLTGCVWTADSPGSSLNCSMTSGTVVIKGILLTVSAVTSRAFTASNDTYVDLRDNGDGTANITYSAVANLTTSPALASSGTVLDTIRIAVISAGGSSVASAGIGQGDIQTMPTNAATLASTTATGAISGGNLPVTAITNFPTGGGWGIATHSQITSTFTFTSASGSNLNGVTILGGGSTFANADVVKGIWPVGVADMLGNPIYNTQPFPRLLAGFNVGVSAFSSTLTSTNSPVVNSSDRGGVIPVVVSAGPSRKLKITWNGAYIQSSAAAGTLLTATLWQGNPTSGGTLVASLVCKVQVASDGSALFLSGITANLAAGTYYIQFAANQGAAGTLSVGVSITYSAYIWVEYA